MDVENGGGKKADRGWRWLWPVGIWVMVVITWGNGGEGVVMADGGVVVRKAEADGGVVVTTDGGG